MTATMSSRLVDGLANALPKGLNRRGFLARTAVVASALAAKPLAYVLEPQSAYAAVCNCKGSACQCGSLCCDGYTEFCCTITGANKCPPNTYLAGWWKGETTPQFCGGPRYYMDCNAPCNGCGCGGNGVCSGSCSGTGCGCANGNCDNRSAGCTLFRYGQCNQQIPCLGPIVCRVITCVPPWAIEPTCTTVPRVDEFTAYHDRPCLHWVNGNLDNITVEGGTIRLSGWGLDFDTQGPVIIQAFVNGAFAGDALADQYRPDVGGLYPGYGPSHGFNFTIGHPGPSSIVCATALNAGYGNEAKFLGCRQVSERLSGPPFGHLDLVRPSYGAVRVTGWVVDPDQAASIAVHVYADDRFLGVGTASLSRPDIGSLFPRLGANHGFDFTVPSPGGRRRICAYGINIGDFSPNALIGCTTVDIPSGIPIGGVDGVNVGAGAVQVVGWTVDPDTAASLDVHLYIDGRLAVAAKADLSRPETATRFPGFGAAHGFNLTAFPGGGWHLLETYAINTGGLDDNPLIDRRQIFIPTGDPIGLADAVTVGPGRVRLSGWVIDPDTSQSVTVHVYADNTVVGSAVANLDRPDIAAAFHNQGPLHGFDVTVPFPRGVHMARVYAINIGPGGSNPLILDAAVNVP